MKKITLLAILLVAASGTVAMACGCAREKVHLQPVQERIITTTNAYPDTCAMPCNNIVSSRTKYVSECPSCVWIPPSKDNFGYAVGNFVTAPFRWITGRSLGQPDVVRTYNYAEPVGERVSAITTHSTNRFDRCGNLNTKITTIKSRSMLMPVGERLTTVKVIKTVPLENPTCEQLSTFHRLSMEQPVLQPVGEITTIRRVEMQPVCAPVGEKTIIKTTKVYSQPLCGCGN